MKCERMRASTVHCRFSHRCGAVSGDRRSGFGLPFGLGIGVATVLRDQRRIRCPLAGLSRKSPQVYAFLRCKFCAARHGSFSRQQRDA